MSSRKYRGEKPSAEDRGRAPADEGRTEAAAGKLADGFADGDSEYTIEQTESVETNLDPQLQDLLLSVRGGGRADPALVQESERGTLVADVLAVLRDPERAVPGLNVVRLIGDVATGTVDVNHIEAVRNDPNVVSLKGARKVSPNLEFSVSEIRASQDDLRDALPAGTPALDGSGVVVGVVDYGCDFAHENFRNDDGTTRIRFLWDQSGPQNSMSPAGFPYGREFRPQDINPALQTSNPYTTLAYNPGRESHGTHVLDIAAGNGRGTDAPGVAPKADIIFVQLSSGDFGDEDSFGNSRRLLEAVDYIFTKAGEMGKSAVVNLSLGTHGGPHDGSTPAERGFDQLLRTPGRAVVISAGNSFERQSHARGRIAPGATRALRWEKFEGDETDNELEVWYGGSLRLEVSLVTPTGQRVGPVLPGNTARIKRQGVEIGRIIHRANDPLNGDNQIDILLDGDAPVGVWNVELRAAGTAAVDFHAWIERDDDNPNLGLPNQSKLFPEDNDGTSTIGSISCGKDTIVVGSYNAAVTGRDLSSFSASGPTRDGKQKPEVSAPGHRINAASSRTGNGKVRKSGTSMAAPHVTGLVALIMQAAPQTLTVAQIRRAVSGAARRNPPPGGDWNPRFGVGRVDAVAALRSVLAAAPEAVSAVSQNGSSHAALNGGDGALSLDRLLGTLVGGFSASKVRLQFEIEIEPMGK